MSQVINSNYKLHNVEIQNYPVKQDEVLVSTSTTSQKNCVKNTCYRYIKSYSETVKFDNVSSAVAELIAYEREVAILIEDQFMEYASFKGYDPASKTLTLNINTIPS